jgi:O-antigen/teichoic acid export membrane protein
VNNLAVPSTVSNDLHKALRGRVMARNSIWNLLGQVLPLLVAAVVIPILISRLGLDRFGILTLAWALVGYFGLFDLGLGRALTKVVSEALAGGREGDAAGAIWTATAILMAVGVVFTLVLFFISHWLIYSVIKVPPVLQHESVKAVYWLAISIPVITVTAGLRGVLEAQHRFGLVNIVRVAMGTFSYLGPLLAAVFSPDLAVICAVLVLGRILAGVVHLALCLKTLPALREGIMLEKSVLPVLISTGAWITVSNTVAPILTYVERFMIGFFLPISAIAYYATPSEMVTRLLMIPGALTTVLFPAFAALSVLDSTKMKLSYDRGIRFCFILVFPAIFLIVLFAPEGLRFWLGPAFAEQSTTLLRWVATGIFVNSIAQIPYALLQAANRPDLPGKLHLLEAPVYLSALVAGIKAYGITGAAAVWALRLILEGLLLLFFVHRTLVPHSLRTPLLLIVTAVAALLVSIFLPNIWVKAAWCAVVLTGGALICWRFVIRREERQHLTLFLAGMTGAKG